MGLLSTITTVLCGTIVAVAAWLGWQLLRQNGRLLLRVEELEQRLDELEFGGDGTSGLPIGSEAPDFELAALAGDANPLRSIVASRCC